MRTRAIELGNRNITGQALCKIRKSQGIKQKDALKELQLEGLELNESGFSKLEGGHRAITDKELLAFSKIYGISVETIYKIASGKIEMN